MAFTQIQDELFKLGYEEAVMITVIQSWSKNKKEHFMSQEEYCSKYHMSKNTYKRCLKKLKDNGIIKVVRKLTNNRSVLVIDNDELEFTLNNGYRPKMSQSLAQNEPTTMHNMHSNRPKTDQPKAQTGSTHIPDKVPDKVTIEDTIKSTKPKSFSFDIFKKEVKPIDIDPRLALFAKELDFDLDID